MPYIGHGKNAIRISYFDHLTEQERQQVKSSREFDDLKSSIWHRHCHQNVYELVDGLRGVEKFEDDLIELQTTDPDYQEACDQNNVCIVDGSQDVFYFNWADLCSVEVTADNDAMIDFLGYAKDKGLDLSLWRFDPETDEVVPHDSERGQELLGQSNALEGYLASNPSADGEDVDEFLLDAALAADLTQLVDELKLTRAEDVRKRYENYINKDFISNQSNDDVNNAAENACEEFGIDADDYRREVYEHYAVDRDMAQALQNQGEKVVELLGLDVWCRTTTGQMVTMDYCIDQVVIHEYDYEMDTLIEKMLPEATQRIQAEFMEKFAALEAADKAKANEAAPAP